MPDQVTVIGGSGALGFGLALRLAAAGVPVVIGSRDAARAEEAAARIREQTRTTARRGPRERPGRRGERGRVPVRAVPQPVRDAHEPQGATCARASSLVDATVPLAAAVSGKATRMLGVWQGSAAQQAAEMVPDGVRVVAALHTVNAPGAQGPRPRARRGRARLRRPPRGQGARGGATSSSIPGLRCVDAGRLEMARIAESLTALLIGVNVRYKTHAGIRLTGLTDRPW